MNRAVMYAKGAISGAVALTVEVLGGSDAALGLLLTLMVCDIASGVLNAFVHKDLSSTDMRNGMVHKILIFLMIVVAVRFDYAVQMYFDKDFHLRLFVIAYFCLEELISVLENVANAGVPIPKWLRSSLKKVSKEFNMTLPRFISEFVKKTFNINLEDKKDKPKGTSNKEVTTDSTETK